MLTMSKSTVYTEKPSGFEYYTRILALGGLDGQPALLGEWEAKSYDRHGDIYREVFVCYKNDKYKIEYAIDSEIKATKCSGYSCWRHGSEPDKLAEIVAMFKNKYNEDFIACSLNHGDYQLLDIQIYANHTSRELEEFNKKLAERKAKEARDNFESNEMYAYRTRYQPRRDWEEDKLQIDSRYLTPDPPIDRSRIGRYESGPKDGGW